MTSDDDRPLVSSRSPSYERARKELRDPSPTADAQLVAELISLTHTERAAARAIGKVADDWRIPEALEAVADGHRRRAKHLAEEVSELGGDTGDLSERDASLLRDDYFEVGAEAAIEQCMAALGMLEAMYDQATELDAPPRTQRLLGELRADLVRDHERADRDGLRPEAGDAIAP